MAEEKSMSSLLGDAAEALAPKGEEPSEPDDSSKEAPEAFGATQEEGKEEEGSPEQASPESPGVQKRIDQLVAEIHSERRDKDRLKTDLDFARNHLRQLEVTVEETKRRVEQPDDPEPDEDATPQEIREYYQRRAERMERGFTDKLNESALNQSVNVQRALHSDFDTLLAKYETTFLQDATLRQRIQGAPDPPSAFYTEAKKMEEGEKAEAERTVASSQADPGGATRSGQTNVAGDVSDEEWATVQRIFPGIYKDKTEYLESKQLGDKIRAQRMW